MLRRLRKKALRGYFVFANQVKLYLKADLDYQFGDRGILQIHGVTVVPTFRTTHIFIKTNRPGLIIGRQGKNIKVLTNNLTGRFGRTKIHLKDFDPFYSR